MLDIIFSTSFKRDLKLAKKRGCKLEHLTEVVNILASGKTLDEKYHDHDLIGRYKGFRECHIEPDWLLIYRIDNNALQLYLFRNGTHSDLFRN